MRRSVDPNNNENYEVLQKNKPPSLCYTYWLHILVTHTGYTEIQTTMKTMECYRQINHLLQVYTYWLHIDPDNNAIYGVLQKNKPPSLCYTYWLHRDPDNNYEVLQINKPPSLCYTYWLHIDPDNNEIYGVLQMNKPPSLCIHILVTH